MPWYGTLLIIVACIYLVFRLLLGFFANWRMTLNRVITIYIASRHRSPNKNDDYHFFYTIEAKYPLVLNGPLRKLYESKERIMHLLNRIGYETDEPDELKDLINRHTLPSLILCCLLIEGQSIVRKYQHHPDKLYEIIEEEVERQGFLKYCGIELELHEFADLVYKSITRLYDEADSIILKYQIADCSTLSLRLFLHIRCGFLFEWNYAQKRDTSIDLAAVFAYYVFLKNTFQIDESSSDFDKYLDIYERAANQNDMDEEMAGIPMPSELLGEGQPMDITQRLPKIIAGSFVHDISTDASHLAESPIVIELASLFRSWVESTLKDFEKYTLRT